MRILGTFERDAVMNPSLIYTFFVGLTMGIAILGFFVWGVSNGAFDSAEDAKYILFRDEDDD